MNPLGEKAPVDFLGIEARALAMLAKCSTTKLHPRPIKLFLNLFHVMESYKNR
jgi:hypothetical protein